MQNLKQIAYKLRQDVVDIIISGKGGHIGGDMFLLEAMVCLFFYVMNVTPENFGTGPPDPFLVRKSYSGESL